MAKAKTTSRPKTNVNDMFKKAFKAGNFRADWGFGPRVLVVAGAQLTTKDDGKELLRVEFRGTRRYWLAGKKEAVPSLVEAMGSEFIEDWVGKPLELFCDVTDFDGPVDCIRARAPSDDSQAYSEAEQSEREDDADQSTPEQEPEPEQEKPAPRKRKAKSGPPKGWPRQIGIAEDGDIQVQFEDQGVVWEVGEADFSAIMRGELTEADLEKDD